MMKNLVKNSKLSLSLPLINNQKGISSHDNGLESTNRYIKDFHTFRHRLFLSQFLFCLINLVKNWSKDRDTNTVSDRMLHESPTIDTRLWTYSFNFTQENKSTFSAKGDGQVKSYYFCSDKKKLYVLSLYNCTDNKIGHIFQTMLIGLLR